MSGGHYDYAYRHIEDLAGSIELVGKCYAAPAGVRAAFKQLLYKVAKAAKAIEWNDSCDGDDNELALIEDCLAGQDVARAAADVLEGAIHEAHKTLAYLQAKEQK